MILRVRHAALFGAFAALLAWTAWSGEATGVDTRLVWCLVGTILVLAGLPRLVRRRLGPVTNSRVARGPTACPVAPSYWSPATWWQVTLLAEPTGGSPISTSTIARAPAILPSSESCRSEVTTRRFGAGRLS
ncbi:MAG: hypothetical protein ACRDOK_23805 [Streptosporangiaceae bacterium]